MTRPITPSGASGTGGGGGMFTSVMVPTSVGGDSLLNHVAVTRKLLAAFCSTGTLIVYGRLNWGSCCWPTTTSPASTWLLLLTSRYTLTRLKGDANPTMVKLDWSTTTGAAGLATTGAGGGSPSSRATPKSVSP